MYSFLYDYQYYHPLLIFIIYLLTCRVLGIRLKWALVLSSLKVLHFMWLFSASEKPFLLDDLGYFMEAVSMVHFLDFHEIWSGDYYGLAQQRLYSQHILYQGINYFSLKFLGIFYASTLVVNHLFFCGFLVIFSKILESLEIDKSWVLLAFLFPDTFFWLGYNVKDFVVLFLVTVFLFQVIKSDFNDKKISSYLISFICLLLLYYLRFYNILLLLVSTGAAYLVSCEVKAKRVFLWSSVFAIFIFFFFKSRFGEFSQYASFSLLGIIRFPITPLPFNLDRDYSFLLLPSILNLIILPIYGYGLIKKSFKLNSRERVIVFWFLANVLFYGSVLELQGPRQRLQITLPILIFFIWGIKEIHPNLIKYLWGYASFLKVFKKKD